MSSLSIVMIESPEKPEALVDHAGVVNKMEYFPVYVTTRLV